METQTKGTGANMVPLERVLRQPGSDAVPGFVLPDLKPPPVEPPEPRGPRMFKVIDVMTRQVLAEGVDARATVTALEGLRSMVDVTIMVWEPDTDKWRMLTLGETKALWEYRGRISDGNQSESAASEA